jgi:hypothetical protein
MRFLGRASLNTLFFSINLGSLCAVGIFAAVPPLSKMGQFLFWPQNRFPFLHLHPDSPFGSRVTFLLLVALVGASIYLLMTLPSTWSVSGSLAKVAAGIAAILAPMVGWLLIGPRGGVPSVLLWTATVAWSFYAAYCVWKQRGIRRWEIALILVGYFGFWTYLFYSRIDPAMLAVPLLACLSYIVWAVVDSAPERRPPHMQSARA